MKIVAFHEATPINTAPTLDAKTIITIVKEEMPNWLQTTIWPRLGNTVPLLILSVKYLATNV